MVAALLVALPPLPPLLLTTLPEVAVAGVAAAPLLALALLRREVGAEEAGEGCPEDGVSSSPPESEPAPPSAMAVLPALTVQGGGVAIDDKGVRGAHSYQVKQHHFVQANPLARSVGSGG